MRNIRALAGFVVSLAFLYIAFRGQNLPAIWVALNQANYWYMVPAVVLTLIGVGIRSFRWSILLRTVSQISGRDLFPVVTVGYAANNVLPLRAGEFVRAYALSRRIGVRKSAVLATIAVERIFDGLTMLGFMLVASLSIALTSQLQHVVLVGAILFGALLGALLLFTSAPVGDLVVHGLPSRLPNRVGQLVGRKLNSFVEGLGVLRRRDALVAVSLTTITAWLFDVLMYATVAEGFGLGVGPGAILLALAVGNLATLIPSSPGYVGPFEAGVRLALVGAVGVRPELALSYAIALHAALYFPITFIGLYFWWRESLGWRNVQQLSSEEAGD